ncbi:hypothetical protein F2P81_024588 [Scophthalmus maximus]|uniref:Uncharacterized protein n=1 Tax=Scophthalmus maximus TaxID=52904 RepID=A0A6A4RVA7_SCOMX|nr:hypothetical protein F2P81_024588 [Scophthalmus maximus]
MRFHPNRGSDSTERRQLKPREKKMKRKMDDRLLRPMIRTFDFDEGSRGKPASMFMETASSEEEEEEEEEAKCFPSASIVCSNNDTAVLMSVPLLTAGVAVGRRGSARVHRKQDEVNRKKYTKGRGQQHVAAADSRNINKQF